MGRTTTEVEDDAQDDEASNGDDLDRGEDEFALAVYTYREG